MSIARFDKMGQDSTKCPGLRLIFCAPALNYNDHTFLTRIFFFLAFDVFLKQKSSFFGLGARQIFISSLRIFPTALGLRTPKLPFFIFFVLLNYMLCRPRTINTRANASTTSSFHSQPHGD